MKTKNTTHTPGPWTMDGHTGIPLVISTDHRICQASYGNEEDFANARLIAAAPTMYDIIEGLMRDGHGDCTRAHSGPWAKEAQKLLDSFAKAEGK